jgi:hypothetical protein
MRARFGLTLCPLLVGVAALPSTASAQSKINPGYAQQDKSYTPLARAGREIWFFPTADRSYRFPQRLGASICWPGEPAQTATR